MKRNDALNNIELRKFIETKNSNLIFSNNDSMDDFYDEKTQNDENDNTDDDENGFDVDIDSEDNDEKESLFTIN
jgi:hypothetical protein